MPRLFLSFCVALAAASAFADVVNDAPRPRVDVLRAAAAPQLAADPADPAWGKAARLVTLAPSLEQPGPLPASLPGTEVRLLWDANFLYVRFLCRDTEIYTPFHGHDAPLFRGDAVEVFLDPVGDARQWIELQFDADNDTFERLFLCTGTPQAGPTGRLLDDVIKREVWEFPQWDLPGLRSAAARWKEDGKEVGWIVDVAVPASGLLKRLGKTKFEPMTLRADFLRYEYGPAAPGGERPLLSLNWSPVLFGGPHRSPMAYGYVTLSP
jgi:hypothetical protein